MMLLDGPADTPLTVVLAHGAGAPMDSPFMAAIAGGLAAAGWRVARFEFPYMRTRRESGRRGRPDPEAILLAAWRDAIDELGGPARLVIGGKSLGGRMASLLADEAGVRGLVCLGYPFRPPGRPAPAGRPDRRLAHLATLRTPTLIVQGTRDPFGGEAAVGEYSLSPAIRLAWIADGDHSFKPRRGLGHTLDGNLAAAVEAVSEFLATLA